MRLTLETYTLSAAELAPILLGKLIYRRFGGEVLKLRITETEAYCGEEDTACHAHKGRTKRTEIMYGTGGTAYIYLCYGIHSLLNVVSGLKGYPEAVLIRAAEGYNGPGKLTNRLKINCSLNGENLLNSDELWIEDDGFCAEYKTAPRVGIDYAGGGYKDIPWRFILTP